MEYSGRKRSNLLLVGFIWFIASAWILLKAIPYQLPLKAVALLNFYKYTIFFTILAVGVLVTACISRDRRLLRAYAGYCVVVLLVLSNRELEIEHELLAKLYNGIVGFFVMPYWGWTRVFEDNTAYYLTLWLALSGTIALFMSRFCQAPERICAED